MKTEQKFFITYETGNQKIYLSGRRPVWGIQFTPNKEDAQTWDWLISARERLESVKPSFPNAKIEKLNDK